MSDGKRFWGKDGPVRCSRNWELVQTRERGDIPNCTPALDVWIDVPFDVMCAATGQRAEKFCTLMQDLPYVEFKNHPFHHTDVPLNPIHNPSARVRQSWDHDFQG